MTTATTSPTTAPRRRKKRGDGWTALLFLSPLLVIYAVYFAYSIFFLGQTSMQKVGISMLRPVQVGFENFRAAVHRPRVRAVDPQQPGLRDDLDRRRPHHRVLHRCRARPPVCGGARRSTCSSCCPR